MANMDNIIKGILNREGGYVNHPADKGGPTKYGITQNTLSAWRHQPVSLDDIKGLSIDEAFLIYKRLYVEDPGFLKFGDEAFVEQLIDAGANHGTTRTIKLLQTAIGVTVDGVIGPQTVQKVSSLEPPVVYFKFMAARLRYFSTVLKNDTTQLVFAAGWMNRCALMTELYLRETVLAEKYGTVLWDVASSLRANAREVQRKISNRPLSINYFQSAAYKLDTALRTSV